MTKPAFRRVRLCHETMLSLLSVGQSLAATGTLVGKLYLALDRLPSGVVSVTRQPARGRPIGSLAFVRGGFVPWCVMGKLLADRCQGLPRRF